SGGGSAPATPPANSSSGAISVAAAVSINIAKTSSSSSLPAGITVGSAGLSLWSSASTDATANADGTATTARGAPSGTSIGAPVAINYATVTNSATVAGTANGPATVRALVTSSGDGRDDFAATATSGAGGGKVGVAGSLALNIVHLSTEATISGTVAAGSGAIELSAASNARSIAKALPANGGTNGASKLGIGASVALNLVDDTTTASITGTAVISGRDLTLRASAAHDMSTDAETGASGGGVSIAPAVAVALSNITTTATVAAGTPLDLSTGGFSASADQTAAAHTNAATPAGGVSAAAAIAINITTTHSLATIGAITVMTSGRFTLSTSADTDAFAAADGTAVRNMVDSSAPADSSGGSGGPVDSTTGVSIGAGVAIDYARIRNEAILPSGATVTANGATIEARAGGMQALGASAKSGAGGGSLSIAGSVAIDIENIETTASLAGMLHAGT